MLTASIRSAVLASELLLSLPATHRHGRARSAWRLLPIEHCPRNIRPASRCSHWKLLGLRQQPVDIVSRNESVRCNCQHFGAAPSAPGLNLPDLTSVQQDLISPAPASERIYFSTGLDTQSGFYCLLYCHSGITFSSYPALEGARKYTKISEGCQELFSELIPLFP